MAHFIDAEILGLAGKTAPTRISFDGHFNIVFGLNGTGKTSLLKILHSAMTGNAQTLQSVPFTRATVRVGSLTYRSTVTRTIAKRQATAAAQAETSPAAPSRGGRYSFGATLSTKGPSDKDLAWTETRQADDSLPVPERRRTNSS